MMVVKRENEKLKQNLAALDELVDSMRFMPEDISKQIFQRLRTTAEPLRIIQSIQGEFLDNNASEQTTAFGGLPSGQTNPELELMARHPLTYPPVDQSEDALRFKLPGFRPYMRPQDSSSSGLESPRTPDSVSLARLATALQPTDGSSSRKGKSAARTDSDSSDLALPNHGYEMMSYFDQRLHQLDISFWTTIEVSNDMVASAISLYLETDHALIGLMDANLFVRDLVGKSIEFCSPFLVNSLLGLALVGTPSMRSTQLTCKYSNHMQQRIQRPWPKATNSKTRL
jgi:hypothetical protein